MDVNAPPFPARSEHSPTVATTGRGGCGSEADAFGDLPRRRRGSSRRNPRLRIPAWRTKENAPSRSRLRPTHPIDLRRSDCRAGEPSTFGAPCSVHSETYWRIWPASSTRSRQCVANCDNRVCLRIYSRIRVHAKAHRGRRLPRPTSQLTAAEATACRRAINLRRSVLGAHGTLRPRSRAVKWEPIAKSALCDLFY